MLRIQSGSEQPVHLVQALVVALLRLGIARVGILGHVVQLAFEVRVHLDALRLLLRTLWLRSSNATISSAEAYSGLTCLLCRST